MLLHYWWECKLIQPLWKMVWKFFKKLGIKPPFYFLSYFVYSKNLVYVEKYNICLFVTVLFHLAECLSSVQSLSCVWLFATPWTAARQASLSFPISQSLLKLMAIESVMLSNCLILCRPLLPLSVFPNIRVFSNESVLCIRWPKFWSFIISVMN